MNTNKSSAVTILRWGLAFVFFYAAIASLVSPDNWIGYFPGFLINLFPDKVLLVVFSIYHITLATLLFVGRKLVIVSLLSVATLVAIIFFNLGTLDVIFRDVGLALAALALYELVKTEKPDKEEDLV